MKKKGFTLVELLVVIAIIALLMGILMPALSRVRQIAFRMVCGTNLSGIGKAMLIYANDYHDEMPRAGVSTTSVWAKKVKDYAGLTAKDAFGPTGNLTTVSSCFYLLVKYTDVTPKSFLCKGDSSVTEFTPLNTQDLIALWDFGIIGSDHCSYSYHLPYGTPTNFPLSTSSDPGMAVAADPSPLSDTTAKANFSKFKPDGTKEEKNFGNSITHQNEGQNVMYLDTHVNFENVSYCGLNEDNIFTIKLPANIRLGSVPGTRNVAPLDRTDSLLVNDEQAP